MNKNNPKKLFIINKYDLENTNYLTESNLSLNAIK